MSTDVQSGSPLLKTAESIMRNARRARELYRYLQPDALSKPRLVKRTDVLEADQDVPDLSSSLASFAQLAALRCNAPKAMLNFMDKTEMYFLAEATYRGDELVDFEVKEQEDLIWKGCQSVPLAGRVCEYTLNTGTLFVVPDLSEDPRFSEIDVVKGSPYFRFYAGTPVTTRLGVHVGSLCVLDTKPRDGLKVGEQKCLIDTAKRIMSYLETNRQAIEGRRSRKMGQGLNRFVLGKRSLEDESPVTATGRRRGSQKADTNHDIHLGAEAPVLATSLSQSPAENESPRRHRGAQSMQRSGSSSIATSSEDRESELHGRRGLSRRQTRRESEDAMDNRLHSRTLARAANLIRESLELGEGGGAAFLGVESKLGGMRIVQEFDDSHTKDRRARNSEEPLEFTGLVDTASVLAFSSSVMPYADQEDHRKRTTAKIDSRAMRYLCKRYPRGRLWTFDDQNARHTSSDEAPSGRRDSFPPAEGEKQRSRRKAAESSVMREAFPQARQVLMAPLFDPLQDRYVAGCFVWSASDTRSMSSTAELIFLNSFCSSIMAECSRLDAVKADKQKSDFVGTISHELRSPLHGILASVEFLGDSDMSSYQRSMIDTVEACGRTLLDTINHVLDFSKINSFEKTWQDARKSSRSSTNRPSVNGPDEAKAAISRGAPALLQLSGNTDISAVLEEVVEGVAAGLAFTSGVEITDLSREARGRGKDQGSMLPGPINESNGAGPPEPVDVILDIEQADWIFMTQPGAVRRVIMNLFGNAIKYTERGSIRVRLQLKLAEEETSTRETMLLTITDTGKGISPQYISSKLFVPFAQENPLAPGTGLGLSICHSIVNMLNGTINVSSRVNEGTTVQVALPLNRPLPGSQSTTSSPHSNSTDASSTPSSVVDDSIKTLGSLKCRIALYERTNPSKQKELAAITKRYITDWYGLSLVAIDDDPHAIIVEEQDLEQLRDKLDTIGCQSALLVLCHNSTRYSQYYGAHGITYSSRVVEYLAKPCGPYKLAKGLRQCIARLMAPSQLLKGSTLLPAVPEQPTPPLSTPGISLCAESLQEFSIGKTDDSSARMVQGTEDFAASQTSQNAQMAINDPSSPSASADQPNGEKAFPFPVQVENPRPEVHDSMFLGPRNTMEKSLSAGPLPSEFTNGAMRRPATTPHVLLVDDNAINLRLLQSFMMKRKCDKISLAENGQVALDAAKAVINTNDQFDVILMDISMPVMNGFEATRGIRAYEAEKGVEKGALIIALTGLATGKDQAEGMEAGCDIYMTKPVSFKEVGKLLDNWEKHQQLRGDANEDSDTTQVGGALAAPLPARSPITAGF